MKSIRLSVDSIFAYVPILALAFYGLNMDGFLGARRWNPYWFQTIAFSMAFVAYVVICVQYKKYSLKSLFVTPIVKWVYFLTFISLVALFVSKDWHYISLGLSYLLSTIVIILSCVISFRYLLLRENTNYGKALFFILFIACLSVVLDPIYDFRSLFAPGLVDSYEVSRGGGVFLQPNVAGVAIVFLYSLVIPRVEKNLAFLATLLAALSVFLTFSRSSMIVISVVIAFGIWCRYLPRYTVFAILTLLLLIFFSVGSMYLISDVFNINQGSGFNRLFSLLDIFSSDSVFQDSRFYLLSEALHEYYKSPVLGGGLGYSWYWADTDINQQGTHNLYLRYMLEFGTIGIFIWPLFVYALFRMKHSHINQLWGFGLSISALTAALFSHNIPEQGVIIAPLIASYLFPTQKVSR